MKIVNFQDTPIHRSIVIDAAFSQSEPFDSVQIMRYIAENEVQGQTFDHHDIGFFLEKLTCQKLIRRANVASYFTKYEVNK